MRKKDIKQLKPGDQLSRYDDAQATCKILELVPSPGRSDSSTPYCFKVEWIGGLVQKLPWYVFRSHAWVWMKGENMTLREGPDHMPIANQRPGVNHKLWEELVTKYTPEQLTVMSNMVRDNVEANSFLYETYNKEAFQALGKELVHVVDRYFSIETLEAALEAAGCPMGEPSKFVYTPISVDPGGGSQRNDKAMQVLGEVLKTRDKIVAEDDMSNNFIHAMKTISWASADVFEVKNLSSNQMKERWIIFMARIVILLENWS